MTATAIAVTAITAPLCAIRPRSRGPRSALFYLYLFLCCAGTVLVEVDAQQQGKGSAAGGRKAPKKKRRGKNSMASTDGSVKGIWWTTNIFLLCLIPPLVIFLRNLWTDPMTPQLWSNGTELAKEKLLGFLGKSKEDAAKENARKMR